MGLSGLSGLGGGSSFTRTPATLVLKDVSVAADESLESLTPFVPPSVPDPDAIIFEVKGSLLYVASACHNLLLNSTSRDSLLA